MGTYAFSRPSNMDSAEHDTVRASRMPKLSGNIHRMRTGQSTATRIKAEKKSIWKY